MSDCHNIECFSYNRPKYTRIRRSVVGGDPSVFNPIKTEEAPRSRIKPDDNRWSPEERPIKTEDDQGSPNKTRWQPMKPQRPKKTEDDQGSPDKYEEWGPEHIIERSNIIYQLRIQFPQKALCGSTTLDFNDLVFSWETIPLFSTMLSSFSALRTPPAPSLPRATCLAMLCSISQSPGSLLFSPRSSSVAVLRVAGTTGKGCD